MTVIAHISLAIPQWLAGLMAKLQTMALDSHLGLRMTQIFLLTVDSLNIKNNSS